MKINILLFGSLIDATEGIAEFQLDDLNDVNKVKKTLLEKYPKLDNYTFRVAVNQQIVENNQVLSDSDVVAFLPPFAGG